MASSFAVGTFSSSSAIASADMDFLRSLARVRKASPYTPAITRCPLCPMGTKSRASCPV